MHKKLALLGYYVVSSGKKLPQLTLLATLISQKSQILRCLRQKP